MRRSNLLVWLGGLTVAMSLAAACGSSTTTTTTTTTTPAVSTTDTFSGSVGLNGAHSHTFTVTTAGAVTATITSLSGGPGFVGFSLGVWNGASCGFGGNGVANDQAVQGSALQGNAAGAGTFCVRLYDPTDPNTGLGVLASPVTYSVSVVHY